MKLREFKHIKVFILNVTKMCRNLLLRIRDLIYCKIKLGYYRETWRFWGIPLIQATKNSRIIIGDNFVACSRAKNNQIGVSQKVILKTVKEDSVIIIGDNVGMSGSTISSIQSIKIGDDTLIGSGVLITDNDAHPINPKLRRNKQHIGCAPIDIGKNVFIGTRTIILKGVNIGDNSVIGAGSVVTSSIPKDCIAAGNPAKIIKYLHE